MTKEIAQMYSRRYKDKYLTVKNVHDSSSKKLPYTRFYKIVKRFFEILFRDVIQRLDLVHLPNKMGYIYLDKKEHKRAFHYKIVWVRPHKYRNCKIMPLTKVKEIIKNI